MFSVALLLLLAAGCVQCSTLTQPASMTLQPGQRLTITCQVSYSVRTYRSAWIRQPVGKGLQTISSGHVGHATYVTDSLKNKFSMDLDSSRNTLTLNGQNMQPGDSAVYYCAREIRGWHAFDYWGKGTMVTVTSAVSSGPVVFPLTQCDSVTGNTVTLGCLATSFSPPSLTYTWTKDGNAITDFIQYPPVLKNDVYSGVSQLKVSRDDWQNNHTYKCVATNGVGTGQGIIKKPEVVNQAPTVKVFVSDEGEEASFSCFAEDFSPKTHEFEWLRNDERIPNAQKRGIKTLSPEEKSQNGTYSAASFLTVPSSLWSTGDKFTCVIKVTGGGGVVSSWNDSVSFKAVSTGPDNECPKADVDIEIHKPDVKDLFQKGKGTLVCEVRINNPDGERISWEDERENDIVGASKSITKGQRGPITLPLDITYDEWSSGRKPTCAVTHSRSVVPFRKAFDRKIGQPTQRPSVLMLPPLEHTKKNKVTLTCYVTDFYPRDVLVSWVVDDMEPDTEYESHQTEPIENKGTYSVYGQLSLSLDKWKKDGSMYGCVVNHESLINATSCNNRAIVRSIGYRNFENTNMVNFNMNTPETCQAK